MERQRNNRSVRGRRGGRGRSNRPKNSGTRQQSRMVEILNDPRGPRNLKNNFPFPQSKIYKLVSNNTFRVFDGSNEYKVIDIELNNIVNPYPTMTSVNPTGISTLVGIYNIGHVQKVSVKYTVSSNTDGVPIVFGIVFRDEEPTTFLGNKQNCIDTLEMGFTSGPNMISEKSGMDLYRSPIYNIQLGKIIGNNMLYNGTFDFTQSLVPSGTPPVYPRPTQKVWLGVVGYTSVSGTNLTNGFFVTLVLTQHVRLFSIKSNVPRPFIGNQEEKIRTLEEKIEKLNKTIEKLLLIDESSSTVEDDDNNDIKE